MVAVLLASDGASALAIAEDREGHVQGYQTIVQHLPYLRRYARALAGTQRAGDAYVAAALEAVIEDPSQVCDAAGSRVPLYRVFTRIWNSVHLNDASEPLDMTLPIDERLAGITPLPRQAFLLVALEGFGEKDAARVLEVNVARLRMLVEDSGRELAAELATDVLIIEDEPLIGLELEDLVESLGHRSIGVATTHAESLTLAETGRPGLILADIKLADGSSGLDAVNELLGSIEVPVVFITAYPEQFLTGTRPEPTFLIAKPFQTTTVSAVMSQALFFQANAKLPEPLAAA
jgi:DNA-directed RNA polymerase specialized sigma24 family protein